ncbi:hypothetical protein [Paracoccus aerius]|uniref:Uncharacterized protein n=2 Tax=Paracoccus TaxID=265 RepID=A0ABS1S579_9RHOB|nr:hypothetical protein [Paracoccus aerius]MBL3673866.1 hypothetical protein [Paracoccus aerius]GHG28058.1 hypothetical protein GCM10017322_28250 [Paracoccus aerius]
METDDDSPFCDPNRDPRMAELLGDVEQQPIPPRLKELADRLSKALAEARKRRDH